MTNQDFHNKTCIITGAGKGIGFEIARQLAVLGVNVVLNDIDPDAAKLAGVRIQKKGGKCEIVIGDSSKIEIIRQLVDRAMDCYQSLDFTIANAGITTFGDFLKYSSDEFDRLVSVNMKGSFFLAQSAANAMISNGTPGKILFMSSVTAHKAHPRLAAYGMTKASIEMLTKCLAIELSEYQINVNAIAPGATLTERNLSINPKYEENWETLIPTGRVSTPGDIAGCALFLLSSHARQINGQTILVDGGWTCYGLTS